MKIKNIIPVTGPVITPEMIKYIRKYLSPDTELSTSQIKVGTPSIECEYDEAMAGPDVLRLCKEAEAEGCDGIFINCFGDPAVKAARELVNIPVFGGFEPAMHLALGLADKIAIISVMKNVLPMIEGEVAKSHFDGRVCCVRSIDIPVEELQQHDRKSTHRGSRQCDHHGRRTGSGIGLHGHGGCCRRRTGWPAIKGV